MSVVHEIGLGGLPRLRLTHPAGATAEVYLYGGHVSSWVPAGGREALFMSRASTFEEGRAIRGGVPLIFPQFSGMGPLPKHGFARVQTWEWLRQAPVPDGTAAATLRLRSSAQTRAIWPYSFEAELLVALGARQLTLALSIRNVDRAPLAFTAALHTYLRVADVGQVAVEGLSGVGYRQSGSASDAALSVEHEPELRLSGPIDRIYLDAPAAVRVHDRAGQRTVQVRSQGMPDVVVWNPWQQGATALADMEDAEYREMLCVEAAHVQVPVELAPDSTWRGAQQLEVGT